MGSFRINELRRAGECCVRGARGGLQMEGVATVLEAAEVSERMWIEERPLHVVGGVRNRASRGTKYVTGRLGGQR